MPELHDDKMTTESAPEASMERALRRTKWFAERNSIAAFLVDDLMGRICIAAIYKLDFPEGMPLMEYDKIIERAVQKSAEEILKTVLGTDMPITSQMIDSAESHAGPEDEDHNGSYTKMIDDDNCVLPGHDNTSAELEPKIIDLEGDDNNVI